jgi:hypothetical protein
MKLLLAYNTLDKTINNGVVSNRMGACGRVVSKRCKTS